MRVEVDVGPNASPKAILKGSIAREVIAVGKRR
jgi:hypothetical protein